VSRRHNEAPFGTDPLDERLTPSRQSDLAKRQELVNPERQLAAVIRAGERRSLPDRRTTAGRPPKGTEERRSGVERRVQVQEVEKTNPLLRVFRPRKERAEAAEKRAAIQAQVDRVRSTLSSQDGPPAA
jgi:hypothetical protein